MTLSNQEDLKRTEQLDNSLTRLLLLLLGGPRPSRSAPAHPRARRGAAESRGGPRRGGDRRASEGGTKSAARGAGRGALGARWTAGVGASVRRPESRQDVAQRYDGSGRWKEGKTRTPATVPASPSSSSSLTRPLTSPTPTSLTLSPTSVPSSPSSSVYSVPVPVSPPLGPPEAVNASLMPTPPGPRRILLAARRRAASASTSVSNSNGVESSVCGVRARPLGEAPRGFAPSLRPLRRWTRSCSSGVAGSARTTHKT